MEPAMDDARQPPANDERPKSTPELPAKPLRPGILKPPPGSEEPLKQTSTKTLRFKMEDSTEPAPRTSATPTTTTEPPATSASAPALQTTAVAGEAVPSRQTSEPVQPKVIKETMGDSPDISPSLWEGTDESEGQSSSSSPSLSHSGEDWDVIAKHKANRRAPAATAAARSDDPALPTLGLLGDHSAKLSSWLSEDMMRYFKSFGSKEGGKGRHAAAEARAARESEEADVEEDDTSLSPPFEDPWRTPFAQCALVTLLGGLALVLVVAGVTQASRRGQVVTRLYSDVTETTVSPEEIPDYMPVHQVPLNDIEKPSLRADATGGSRGYSEGEADFLPSDSLEDASALAGTSEMPNVLSTSGERPQEILGKLRKLKDDTVRPSGKAKNPRVCQPPSFTYCDVARFEFYYNDSSGDCETVSREVQLCNRGPNRFSSKQSCHRKCVTPKRPENLCSQRVSFVKCSRQDYKDVTRWYFDGKRCRRWQRPRKDRCPSDHVFATAQDCKNACTSVNASECDIPKLTNCGSSQRLSPYFAHRASQSDPFHCISVSSLMTSRERVCLAGPNRFGTMQACREACTRGEE